MHVVAQSLQCLFQWWAPPCDKRNHPYHLHPKPPRTRPTVRPNEGLLQRVAALLARELPPQLTHHQTLRALDQSCSRRVKEIIRLTRVHRVAMVTQGVI
eukprot:Gb_28115 [translate_table: standard]